jgi:hypothetical protein
VRWGVCVEYGEGGEAGPKRCDALTAGVPPLGLCTCTRPRTLSTTPPDACIPSCTTTPPHPTPRTSEDE